MSELYKFVAKDIEGEEYSFENLRGKVVLIVNTASKCGLTSQYQGLQELHEKYSEKGLVILGFPSNDFLFQEPGTNNEIKDFCISKYNIGFKMFEKIRVRGLRTHPLYKFLITGAGNKEFKGFIKWNFTKFLFDRDGNVMRRFAPAEKPKDFEDKIVALL